MILRAKQQGEVLIVELEGHLDFETTQEFKNTCTNLIKTNKVQKVVFNMEKLKFVGSSSINQFVRTVKEFNSPKFMKPKPKFCSVSREFHRILRAYQTMRNPFDIFETEPDAIAAFDETSLLKKLKRLREETL